MNDEWRIQLQECTKCYHQRIAGQAFTSYECSICHKKDKYPNTAIPIICMECAKFYNICRRCGYLMD